MKKIMFVLIMVLAVMAIGFIVVAKATENIVPDGMLGISYFDPKNGIQGYMPNPHISFWKTYGECSVYDVEANVHDAYAFSYAGSTTNPNYFYWNASYWRPGINGHDPRHTYILEWCRLHPLQGVFYSYNAPVTWHATNIFYVAPLLRNVNNGYPAP